MSRRWALVTTALALILAMTGFVPFAVSAWGLRRGYLTVFLLYWVAFCLPVGLAFQGARGSTRILGFASDGVRWIPVAVLAQLALVAGSFWSTFLREAPQQAVLAAAGFGALNAFCEEYFWRGTFLVVGRGDWRFELAGVGLFTLWHVPIALAPGVTYPGGALAVIGGAAALGSVFALLAHAGGRIGWAIVAHAGTNAMTLVPLLTHNFL